MPPGIRFLRPSESEKIHDKSWPDPQHCRICGGTKTFRGQSRDPEHLGEVVDFECPCREQWMMFRYFLSNGIALRYQVLGWRDTEGVDTRPKNIAMKFVGNLDRNIRSGRGLYLSGPQGTGKTMIGTLILKAALAKGYSGHFTTFYELLQDGSEGFRSEVDKEWFEDKVRNSDLLMIDDPGKEMHQGERQIDFKQSMLDDVIRHRTSSLLSTIVTSNSTFDDFRKRYGVSIASLMTETMEMVPFQGQDYRPISDKEYERMIMSGEFRPVVVA